MNFAPRVKVPVLLLNGKDDFSVPPAAARRFLELLGTPADHKKLLLLEGGHVPTTCAARSAKCWTGTTSIWDR